MATFEVKILPITIENHPNADVLELAVVGDYRAVVARGTYKTGDFVAYIPEAAIVPDWLITKLNLEGRLAGKAKNRVKAIKLRGILSQGLVLGCDYHPDLDCWSIHDEDVDHWQVVIEGMDVREFLGITKYEPPIPVHMSGEVQNLFGYTLKYDIENVKKFPEVLIEGEDVVITEKLHGTWACWGTHPDVGLVVTSKGLSERGLAFKINEANEGNLYIKTLMSTTTTDTPSTALDRAVEFLTTMKIIDPDIDGVYLLGEIFGGKVQDLKYGLTEPEFRLFDVFIGNGTTGRYLDIADINLVAVAIGVKSVPALYCGPYGKDILLEHTNGRETVSGKEANIREGVVIKPTVERRDSLLGRVNLKSINEKYLLRKNGTEFN